MEDKKTKIPEPQDGQFTAEMTKGLERKYPYPKKTEFKPTDFRNARFWETPKEYADSQKPRYVGEHLSVEEAYGAYGDDDKFNSAFKPVGQTKSGADIWETPDHYYSGNPRINSMAFKTKEDAEDYLENRFSKYDFGDNGITAPEAYMNYWKSQDNGKEESEALEQMGLKKQSKKELNRRLGKLSRLIHDPDYDISSLKAEIESDGTEVVNIENLSGTWETHDGGYATKRYLITLADGTGVQATLYADPNQDWATKEVTAYAW